MHKRIIRQAVLQKRLAADAKDIALFSGSITKRLLELKCIQNAGCIMAYWPHKNEPELEKFMHTCLDMKKRVLLPRVLGEGNMIAVDYHKESIMKKNKYGIFEPVEKSEQYSVDIVIVPGIAFDESLHRIGYGGGYYDRFLSKIDAVKVGVCFESQIIDNIQTHEFDVRMDIIVTQNRIIGAV